MMNQRAPKPLLLLLALLGWCCSCSGPGPRPEAVPYRYRQPLLGTGVSGPRVQAPAPPTEARRRPGRKPRARWRRAVARRCRGMVGRTFRGKRVEARLRLVEACLRRRVAPRLLREGPQELQRHRARPGDLVLFHNTRDANRNGEIDDAWTDVGVVVRARSGRVDFVYLRRSRAHLGVLDLKQPHRRRTRAGDVKNTYLRTKRRNDPARTPYLAGELLAGFVAPPAAGAL